MEDENSIFKKCKTISRKKPSSLDLLEVNSSASKSKDSAIKEQDSSIDVKDKNDTKGQLHTSTDVIDNTVNKELVDSMDIIDNNDNKEQDIPQDIDIKETKEHDKFKNATDNMDTKKMTSIDDIENDDTTRQVIISQDKIDKYVNKIKDLELENITLTNEIKWLQEEVAELKAKCDQESKENKENVDKLKKLEIQYAMLKEKSNGLRTENDLLVEKIQKLHKDLGKAEVKNKKQRASVTVSVSEYEDNDNEFMLHEELGEGEDDLFYSTAKPEKPPGRPLRKAQSLIVGIGKKKFCCVHEEIMSNEEKRFEEAAEQILRLEQRVACLQKANNVNSCASCKPLRSHVVKVEKELQALHAERATQLEELYELKQEALSSAVSEKDAHLSWLKVTTEGNVHTKEAIDKLKRERRDLLQRMKNENDNRMKLMQSSMNTSMLFTLPAKITALGAFGQSYSCDEERLTTSTSSFQSISTTTDMADMMLLPSPVQDEDTQSTKSC